MRGDEPRLHPVTLSEYEFSHVSGEWYPSAQRIFWLTNEESRELHECGDTIEAAERILAERTRAAKGHAASSAYVRVHRHLLHSKFQWTCVLAANRQSRMLEALATPTRQAAEAMRQAGIGFAHHSNLATDKIDWSRTVQCGEHVADTWEGFATETTGPQRRADELLKAVKPLIGKPNDRTEPVLDAQAIAGILARGVRVGDEVSATIEPVSIGGAKYFRVSYGPKENPNVYTLDFPLQYMTVETTDPEGFLNGVREIRVNRASHKNTELRGGAVYQRGRL